MTSAVACLAKFSNALRGSWMASISSGNCGSLVKQGVASVVRNGAGCAAIGTLTALRISRTIDSILSGSCSQLAPTESAPASIMARAQSAGEWPSEHSVSLGRKVMVAMIGRPLSRCALDGNQHLLQVKESLQNKKVHSSVRQQPNLLWRSGLAHAQLLRTGLPVEKLRSRTEPATNAYSPLLRAQFEPRLH